MKRVISILLSTMLLFSLMPAMAFAENDFEEPEQRTVKLTGGEDTDEEATIKDANDLTVDEEDAADTSFVNAQKLAPADADGWGNWSEWQDEVVSESATRQVETRYVPDSYNMETYTYGDSGSPSGRGFWPSAQGGNWRFHYTTTWSAEVMNSLYGTYPAGTYYNPAIPGASQVAGMIHDATAYVSATVDSYHPMFIKNINYKTQYRYRDKTPAPAPAPAPPEPAQPEPVSNNEPVPVCTDIDPGITNGYISWNVPNADVNGYVLQYSTSSKFRKYKTIKIKGRNNCSCRIKGLKAGTTYYIRIRIYVIVKGKTVYRPWCSTIRMKTCSRKGNLASVQWDGLSSCTYTGKAISRSFTLYCNGTALKKGTDYKVKYKNNRKVGTATIIIKGCGRYFGTIRKTFRINPKGTKIAKCRRGKNKIKVSWKKRSKYCSGYQIRYCTSPDFSGCKVKTVRGKGKNSCTLKGLSAGSTYYIEIRIYYIIGKKTYHSSWSRCKSVKIKTKKTRAAKDIHSYTTKDECLYRVIKVGDYAYCYTYNRIYKVNLKTKKKKLLVYLPSPYNRKRITGMFMKDNYIYYTVRVDHGDEGEIQHINQLIRVDFRGNNNQLIMSPSNWRTTGYKLKNNKIYYYYIWGNGLHIYDCQQMDMDGSNQEGITLTQYGSDPSYLSSNVPGYSVTEKEKNNKLTYSLKMPKKKTVKLQ